MQKKIKLFDFKDWPSWGADYISTKLNSMISDDFKRKRTIFNKFSELHIPLKKIASNVYDAIYAINGKGIAFRMRINNSDPEVFDQIILKKEYLPLVELIKEKKKDPLVLVDLGANTGYTSIYLSAFFKLNKIILVEPQDETFEILRHNVQSQLSKTKCILEHKGVWSKTTRLNVNPLFRDGKAWSYSLVEDNANGKIEVIGIKELIDKNGLEEIDILKIDIEGAEADLFQYTGLMSSILTKTRFIAIEIHDEFECRDRIEKILEQSHFSFFNAGELTIGFNLKKY
ncbi:MAG TPA: FkbM family methyltransferase [Bacteroidia bacterium]|jgi:FkbM family methyltransferase|nr:FkbM family methyltransferase [Bacteroidia bacterium]